MNFSVVELQPSVQIKFNGHRAFIYLINFPIFKDVWAGKGKRTTKEYSANHAAYQRPSVCCYLASIEFSLHV